MKFPLADRPFRGATVSAKMSKAYDRMARNIAVATLNEYERFTLKADRVMDPRIWKAVKSRENVTVYKQIRPDPTTTQPPPEAKAWRMPKLVAVGTIAGTLADIMYGVVTPDAPSIAVKTSYVQDELLDSAVLHKVRGATEEDPFRFVGLKWIAMGHPAGVNALVRPRDFVFVESTGVQLMPDGTNVGFHVTHSVELPQCPELPSIVRARLSNCYLYRELEPGVVEVYMTTFSDPGGNAPLPIAVMSAANTLIGIWKAAWCAQNKKLAWVLSDPAARDCFRVVARVNASTKSQSCGVCRQSVRGLRATKYCELCTAAVCTKCRLRRTLSSSNHKLQLIQRHVEICKSCCVMVAHSDAMEIAREEYVYASQYVPDHVPDLTIATRRGYVRSPELIVASKREQHIYSESLAFKLDSSCFDDSDRISQDETVMDGDGRDESESESETEVKQEGESVDVVDKWLQQIEL